MNSVVQYGGTVYIMTNYTNFVLYTGVTSDLLRRVLQHKNKMYPQSFTAKYNCNKLVYYKVFETIDAAILYEKKIKGWHRDWKIKLITEFNSNWLDLTETLE